MKLNHNQHKRGFALIATLSLVALLAMVAIAMLGMAAIHQRNANSSLAMSTAQSNARMALTIAIGELQRTAGSDQRVTATASILGSAANPYAGGTTAQNGKMHWTGVWDTSAYSPANPDGKAFVRWLVSGNQAPLSAIGNAGIAADINDINIFEGVDANGMPDPSSTIRVPKVQVTTPRGTISNYAYWVDDEGVKADLDWNEIPAATGAGVADQARAQAARLSVAPGSDHAVFEGPFKNGVSHPLKKGSGYLDNLGKAHSPSDMPMVMADPNNHSDWLKLNRHDMAMNVRGVLTDVKNGGLRRDLSLAFEMDGDDESEDATNFNAQNGEFVGNGDNLSSPHVMPGTELNARHVFRDYGPGSSLDASGAGNAFSDHITMPLTTVRGPSWWLLRDYANLYKRMQTSGSGHALSARAYFPNQNSLIGNNIYGNIVDVHSIGNPYDSSDTKRVAYAVSPVNRETSDDGSIYAYRPVRASYAPVLLGVNAIFSLKYEDDKLKMIVDPFFIVWNPYNTQITADNFAINWSMGFHGGMRFKHTYPDGSTKYYGSSLNTNFAQFADNHIEGSNGNVSYLISDLALNPGEVMLYSPPSGARGSDANELHDKLEPGMEYGLNSGIKFNEFPDEEGENWAEVSVDSSEKASHSLDVAFTLKVNTRRTGSAWNQGTTIETHLPAAGITASQLQNEADFGENLAGSGFRIRHYAGRGDANQDPNLDWGTPQFQEIDYTFEELSVKKSFGMMTMLTLPTDYYPDEVSSPNTYTHTNMEVFSQLNVTPIVRTRAEIGKKKPLNLFVKAQCVDDIDNLMGQVGIDIDAWNSGDNGFYGKNYSSIEGDTSFPLLDIPRTPMHSLVQLSGANIGTRLFEPTNAIGNSWKPPYIPQGSIYSVWQTSSTINDVSWQINDALFDRYFLSGIAPDYTIGVGGYNTTESLNQPLGRFYGNDPATAKANPALEPHTPSGKSAADIVTELTAPDGYMRTGAYSMIKGAFNVNSTSVKAWRAFLQGNKALALQSVQGTNDTGAGTPFPLASITSNTSSTNGWEQFSRLTDDQIWDDNGTPSDLTDDAGLAVEIVNQVRNRGPFMSLSDFINRHIIANDNRSHQGAIQAAIEQADVNSSIRANTSEVLPDYSLFPSIFPYADDGSIGNRNNATGIPMEINQANILLPLAPKLAARTDTFKIRGYGEVVDVNGNIIAQATCEAVVQRLSEYVDPDTDPTNNEPWDDDFVAPTLNITNQTFGRRFKIQSLRWLNQNEV